MAKLLTKALAKYLNTFFKGFKSDNWSSAILKGKVHFQNLEFNEVVMHQFLEIPPHLLLKKMTCDDLMIKIAITKLGSKPVRVIIGNISIVLEESKTLRRPPCIVQAEPQEYKRSFITNIVENMTFEIGSISISIQTIGDPSRLPPKPITIKLEKMNVDVTDSRFGIVSSIADLVNANKGQPEILLYRLIAIEKISISIGESVVLDRTSTEIKVTATLDANDGLLRDVGVVIHFDRVALSFIKLDWESTIKAVEGIYWCYYKPYRDETVRVVSLPNHPAPPGVKRLVDPLDAGVQLADDIEYAKLYGHIIPGYKFNFDPLVNLNARVDINVGILHLEFSPMDLEEDEVSDSTPSSGCVVAGNALRVVLNYSKAVVSTEAAEATKLAFEAMSLLSESEATPTDESIESVVSANDERKKALERATIARQAAMAKRVESTSLMAVSDAAARQRAVRQGQNASREASAQLNARASKDQALADSLMSSSKEPRPLLQDKKSSKASPVRAAKWAGKMTGKAGKATGRALGLISKKDSSKKSAAGASGDLVTPPSSGRRVRADNLTSSEFSLLPSSTTSTPTNSDRVKSAPSLPTKLDLPPEALASPRSTTKEESKNKSLLSPRSAVDAQDDPLSALSAADSYEELDNQSDGISQSVQVEDLEDDEWAVLDDVKGVDPQLLLTTSKPGDVDGGKWRPELFDVRVKVNASLGLLTMRDAQCPADAPPYLVQPLTLDAADRSRKAQSAVSVRASVGIQHNEHMDIDVALTLAPICVRAEQMRWAAIATAVVPYVPQPPPWMPADDPDEIDSLRFSTRLLGVRVCVPPTTRKNNGLLVLTARDCALQLVDADELVSQDDVDSDESALVSAALAPVQLPSPGFGVGRLCARAAVRHFDFATRKSSLDEAGDGQAGNDPLADGSVACGVTVGNWRAMLRWSAEQKEIQKGKKIDVDVTKVPEKCDAKILLVAHECHGVVDVTAYERLMHVGLSWLQPNDAKANIATVPTTPTTKAANVNVIGRPPPLSLELDCTLRGISMRVRLRPSESLPYLLSKAPSGTTSDIVVDLTEIPLDVLLFRVEVVSITASCDPLWLKVPRIRARVTVSRFDLEIGRPITGAPIALCVLPTDQVDEAALLSNAKRESLVWFAIDAPLALNLSGKTDANAKAIPLLSLDIKQAGDANADAGIVGISAQIHVLEQESVLKKSLEKKSDAVEWIASDDWLQKDDIIAVNAFIRRLNGASSNGTPSDQPVVVADVPITDLAPLSLDMSVRDIDVRLFDKRGNVATLIKRDEQTSDVLNQETAVSQMADNALRRLLRLRLARGSERQRKDTSTLVPLDVSEQLKRASEVQLVADTRTDDALFDELHTSLNDAKAVIAQLKRENELLQKQVILANQRASLSQVAESERSVVAQLQRIVQELSVECANQRNRINELEEGK